MAMAHAFLAGTPNVVVSIPSLKATKIIIPIPTYCTGGASSESILTAARPDNSIKADGENSDIRLVFPGIHPGPYHPVGGSNIPYTIYKSLDSQAMVMHSISDHAMNLPSAQHVENYVSSLSKCSISDKGATCTEPVSVQINRARVTGILFGKTQYYFSHSPRLAQKTCQAQYRIKSGNTLRTVALSAHYVVDCHNAMGDEISDLDSEDMVKAARSCLDDLISKPAYPLEFGYANSKSMNLKALDLANGGIGVLCLRINGTEYHIWSDSNNMENGVQRAVISQSMDTIC